MMSGLRSVLRRIATVGACPVLPGEELRRKGGDVWAITFVAVGKYESYATEILRSAFGDRWDPKSDVVFSFGPDAGTGEVDGIIDGTIAVEIGVGSPKQIRASVLET